MFPTESNESPILEARVTNSAEDEIELDARHGEGEVLAPLRAPRSELYRGLRRDAEDRERLAFSLVRQAQDPGIEVDALRAVVHR
jgi:hypothetical protein